jgi:hypothetical protein
MLDPGLKKYREAFKKIWSKKDSVDIRHTLYSYQTKADLIKVANNMDVIIKNGPKSIYVDELSHQLALPAWCDEVVFNLDPDQKDWIHAEADDLLEWFSLDPKDWTPTTPPMGW